MFTLGTKTAATEHLLYLRLYDLDDNIVPPHYSPLSEPDTSSRKYVYDSDSEVGKNHSFV